MPMGIMRLIWVSLFLILLNMISIHGHMLKKDECTSLFALKQSLKFHTEPYSGKLVSWNSSMRCCSWIGVTCENGQVVALDLRNEGIYGGLHNSSILFDLQHLKTLDLSLNNFSAPLPEAIGRLLNLENLVLFDAGFVGQIPVAIGNLFQLSKLDLSILDSNADLPDSIYNFVPRGGLALSSYKFSGPIPDLSRLKKLTSLNLAGNSLAGPLPSSLFALPSLQELYLDNNKLEGPLPLSLYNFHNLKVLDLSSNNFSGTVELSDLHKLENLETLDLSYNSLSIATDSRNFPWFPNGIRSLKLASCNLVAFPNLVNRSLLEGLDLSNNQIEGEIPNWIWNVREVNFSSNLVSGSVLQNLDLSNNQIQGEIPKWIWDVTFVNLSCNLFETLERPLPNMNLPSRLLIDLHHNMLRGPIPLGIRKFFYIDFSDNRFTSTIPVDIGHYLSSSVKLSLGKNQIVGAIPLSICNAGPNFGVLDLSHNRLTGMIPPCLFNMSSNPAIVNLSGNKLKGVVPGTFSQGCGLRTLDLNQNMIEGEIPTTLANCVGLEFLNLAYNKIHGKFPCWLKDLPNLQVLVLRSNELIGPVQCTNSMNSNLWTSLRIIDVASNKLFGALPSEFFSEHNAMTQATTEEHSAPMPLGYMPLFGGFFQDEVMLVTKGLPLDLVKIFSIYTSVDFSSNMFSGKIPDKIGRLTALHWLNLSHNALVGQIPSTLGDMKALESLDLSHNSLNGSIPDQLKEVTFLSHLDLSFNQLEGMIPTGSQLQRLPESAFLGNKGLCGSPLSVKCSSPTPDCPKIDGRLSHAGFLVKRDFMMGSEVGFIFALVITVGPLVLYPRWSRFYYRHVDEVLLDTFGIRPMRRPKRHVSIIR